MEFKDRIKMLREEKKLNHSQLAAVFNKSEGAIRMWETGKTKPDCDTLIQLSRYFNCTTDFLLGLNEYKNSEDLESTLGKYEDLAVNIGKLQEREYESFFYQLNSCIDFIVKNPLTDDKAEEYNAIADNFRIILSHCREMCETAFELKNELREHGVDTSEGIYKINFDISCLTSFINSKNIFYGAIDYCYNNLVTAIEKSLNNEDEKSAISNMIINSYTGVNVFDFNTRKEIERIANRKFNDYIKNIEIDVYAKEYEKKIVELIDDKLKEQARLNSIEYIPPDVSLFD